MLAHRYLFEQLVRRELRQRYKGSVLGIAWYLINPLVLMAAYALMFGLFLPLPRYDDYPLFLIVGIVVWTFFSQSVLAAAPSLVEQASLIAKARFPRGAIPSSVVAVQAVTLAALLTLLVPLMLIVRGTLEPALLAVPLALLALAAFVLGAALGVSVLHAYYRDVGPILAAALLPWFFLSPIFFEPDAIAYFAAHDWARILIEWVNPIAPFIRAIRDPLYAGAWPDPGVLLYVVVAGATALAGGRALFMRLERELAVVL